MHCRDGNHVAIHNNTSRVHYKSGLTLTAAAADRQCAVTTMLYYDMSNTLARGGDHVEWVRAVCARLGGKVVVVVEH